MDKDARALSVLFESSTPGAIHPVAHYLYFPTAELGAVAARRLLEQGFRVEDRRGADQVNWLILAHHEVVPTEELMKKTRQQMEKLATEFGGEYDGWEAEVR